MRRLIQTSAAALVAAAALAFGGCGTNGGNSFMRGSDTTTQVQRPAELKRGDIPSNVTGTGGSGGDPGNIQNGSPKPLGIPQTGAQLSSGQQGAQGSNDVNSDENVQGQGTMKPGVNSNTLSVDQQKQPLTHGTLPR